MGRYKVLLRGDNYLLNLDGEHGKFGFYATRIIKSASLEEAERIAIIRLHQELNQSTHIVKNIPDVPTLSVEKTEKLGIFQFVRKKRIRGLSFFKEDELIAEQPA